VLPKNLLDTRSELRSSVPPQLRAIYDEATVTVHGSSNWAARHAEIQHREFLRYIIVRQNGSCILLTARSRPNTTRELLQGVRHSNYLAGGDDSSSDEEDADNLEVSSPEAALEWMFETNVLRPFSSFLVGSSMPLVAQ